MIFVWRDDDEKIRTFIFEYLPHLQPLLDVFYSDTFKQIVEKKPANVEDLLAQESMEVAGKTVQEVLVEKIATIGENINIRRDWVRGN